MNYLRAIILRAIVGVILALSFYYQEKTFAFEAVDQSIVRDSLYTLAGHTEFFEELSECKNTSRFYFHPSNGVPESTYFQEPGMYVVVNQSCDWGERSMYMDLLSEHPQFERLEKVPLYPSMS